MTSNQPQSPGSSLPQIRDDSADPRQRRQPPQGRHLSHSHAHFHNKRLQHSHHRYHAPASHNNDLRERQAVDDASPADIPAGDTEEPTVPFYTHVIQTISLIYGTDSAGLPSIQTLAGPPATVVVDSHTGETVAAISAQDVAVTPAASASDPASSEAPAPSEPPPAASPPPSTETSSSSSLSDVDITPTSVGSSDLTSAPLPASSASISSHHAQNATTTSHTADHSLHSATNSTILKATDLSTTSLEYTTTPSRPTYISHTTLSSFFSSSTTESATATESVSGGGSGGGGGLAGDNEDQAQPSTTADSGSSDPLSPQEKQIVGGVVGGVAGAAFFLMLILLALRWKKRKNAAALEDDHDMGTRGISDGGGGSGGGPVMSQRSSMPAAVTAALASLTGKRHPPPPPEPASTGERGFYRVSGRKLTSVLQTGGDGYSDPHQSVASGTSDYYRGSQSFEPGAASRLALGSPMRPVSGVVVMREGPGRTPVHEQNPFADPPSPPPIQGPGTLGRSLASQDGSRGSGSRFQERI